MIQNSILAGEILFILENTRGSIRIVDIEKMLHTTEKESCSAVGRLLSDGLVALIREDDRSAIILTKNTKTPRINYLARSLS